MHEYLERLEKEVPEFIENHIEECMEDFEMHKVAKDMLMTLWVMREICKQNREMGVHSHESHANGYSHENNEHAEIHPLSSEEIKCWLDNLKNEDNSKVMLWTIAETDNVAKQMGYKFEHFTPKEFNLMMNVMRSDRIGTYTSEGTNNAQHYAKDAYGWLMDNDTIPGREKLAQYYRYIVKPAIYR